MREKECVEIEQLVQNMLEILKKQDQDEQILKGGN